MANEQKIDYAHMTYGPKAKRYKNYISNCPVCDGELDELDTECKYCGFDLREMNKEYEQKLSKEKQQAVEQEIERLASSLIYAEKKSNTHKVSLTTMLYLLIFAGFLIALVGFRMMLLS